jgi:hypothetical protein
MPAPWEAYAGSGEAAPPAAPSEPPPAKPSPLQNFSRQVGDVEGELSEGSTFGFFPQVAGFLGGTMGLGKLTGHPGTYEQYKEAAEERHERFSRAHPLASGALQLAGGAAVPGLGAASKGLKAAGVGSGLARSAIIGAGLGGVSAAGHARGGLKERLEAVPGGAAEGALTGAAVHGAIELAPHVAPGLSYSASRAAALIRRNRGEASGDVLTPQQRAQGAKVAADYVRRLAAKYDPTGEKLRQSRLEKAGKPVTAAEALGRPAESQLKMMGRRSGKTPDLLEQQLRARHAETASRIVQDFAGASGLTAEEVSGDFHAQTEKLRAEAKPLYDQAYAVGPVDTPQLREVLNRAAVKTALGKALRMASNEGVNPTELGFETRTTQVGRHEIEEQVEVKTPTMRTWDYVKRALDDVVNDAKDPKTGRLTGEGRTVAMALKQLRDLLTDEKQPWGAPYKAALDAGGEPIRLEEAFNGAPKLMSNTMSDEQFSREVAKMSPSQVQALKAGVVDHIVKAAEAGKVRLGEFTTKAFGAKLKRLFGEEAGTELSRRIEDERFLMAHGQRMTPGIGADTSETLLADEEGRTQMNLITDMFRKFGKEGLPGAIWHAITAGVGAGSAQMQQPIDEAARDVAGALLAGKPSDLALFLEHDGASREEAGQVTAALAKMGAFGPNAPRVIAALSTFGAWAGERVPPVAGAVVAGAGAETQHPPPSDDPESQAELEKAYQQGDQGGGEDAGPKGPWDAYKADGDGGGQDMSAEPKPFTPDPMMAAWLAYHVGAPVRITSSFRDPEHNREVGGAEGSAHTRGEAWDFVPEGGVSIPQAAKMLLASGIKFDQLEIAPDHLHISFDPRNRGQVIEGGRRTHIDYEQVEPDQMAEGGEAPPAGDEGGGDEAEQPVGDGSAL